MKIVRRGYAFSATERLRLVASYQRYAVLLLAVAAALLFAANWVDAWWAWAVAVIGAVKLVAFMVEIAARLPDKIRLTAVAQRRINAGRFRPSHVRNHCGDPCFRVVAHEILRRAGTPAGQRRRLIARFSSEVHAESHETYVFDHRQGQVFRSEGERLVPLEPPHHGVPT